MLNTFPAFQNVRTGSDIVFCISRILFLTDHMNDFRTCFHCWLLPFSDICMSGMLVYYIKTALGLCLIGRYANALLFFFPYIASPKTGNFIIIIKLEQQNCGLLCGWALESISTMNFYSIDFLYNGENSNNFFPHEAVLSINGMFLAFSWAKVMLKFPRRVYLESVGCVGVRQA